MARKRPHSPATEEAAPRSRVAHLETRQKAGQTPGEPDQTDIDLREERLFRALDDDNDEAVRPRDFEQVLAEVGLREDDGRLSESLRALHHRIESARRLDDEARKITRADFCQAIRHNILLIERALQGRMVIPDFKGFSREIEKIYSAARSNREGRPADYIPQLNLQGPDADRFGVALCTVDGQRLALGDSGQFFTVQSTTKPISYSLALEEHGPELVHRFVGHEPSGAGFNELTLNKLHQPHNPMINAGAIMSCALVKLSEKQELLSRGDGQGMDLRGWSGRRFDYVMNRWAALCGNETPRFSTSVFLSERETADRNYALAYFMREKGAFPEGADLHDVLEFYIQCCSIELNAEMMSVIAATLANGGICPVTGERVFKTETVRNCLSLMSGCGMYDFSGEFAFTIGLPAKSGVSGAIMVVVPNVMGFCTWSPRLDELGNSVRGIDFCQRLVDTFNFHNFDNLTGNSAKRDPRLNPIQVKARQVNEMIWAASKGDLGAIQDQLRRGSEPTCADYDLRTPLHLAAAENQLHVVRFFVDEVKRGQGAFELDPKDRWGGTPLDDAYLQGHDEIIDLLEQAGARRGQVRSRGDKRGAFRTSLALIDSPKTDELIWAASLGDMGAVRRLVAQGVPLESADYDHRTAMHLAAAEGHLDVVRYFIAHGVPVNPTDRWGNTPLDDALRHGRETVAELLRQSGAKCRGRKDTAVMARGRNKAA
jgi:glutaminase